jgi:sialate O-acetylesterase
MNIKQLNLILLSLIFSVLSVNAEIKVASILGDNMVLQRNSSVKIWGKATVGKKISVKTGWNNLQNQTTANEKGEWLLTVKTTEAGGPYKIEIQSGKEKIQLQNILLGEVWLCSGQSNMEMPVLGFPYQPVLGSNDALLDADNPNLRLFTVKKAPMSTPQDTCNGKWEVANAESVGKFSAVGYFYAKLLQQKLKIPVGIICSSVGGTRIEAWMNSKTLANFPEPLKLSSQEAREQNRPSHLYNGMIQPIINYNIKGVIWYQAESNRNNFKDYAALFTAMVASWRSDFGVGNFPFYYVQIAPYSYGDSKGLQTAYLREQQFKAMTTTPNSGMVSTLDIGSEGWIHPAEKQTVSKRLACWALSETYNFKGISYKSPTYKSMEIKDSIVNIFFDNAEYGLTTFDKSVDCFEIAGKDSVFYPAKILKLNNDFRKIQLMSDKVKVPIAVRYAFSNFPKTEGYLFSTAGLPVPSFRTDNW